MSKLRETLIRAGFAGEGDGDNRLALRLGGLTVLAMLEQHPDSPVTVKGVTQDAETLTLAVEITPENLVTESVSVLSGARLCDVESFITRIAGRLAEHAFRVMLTLNP